jgi:type I restriction enzyme M protein
MNETNNTSGIISKVWSFCHTLRDDGVGYGDYLEQLTFFLLKSGDRRTQHRIRMSNPFFTRNSNDPALRVIRSPCALRNLKSGMQCFLWML